MALEHAQPLETINLHAHGGPELGAPSAARVEVSKLISPRVRLPAAWRAAKRANNLTVLPGR